MWNSMSLVCIVSLRNYNRDNDLPEYKISRSQTLPYATGMKPIFSPYISKIYSSRVFMGLENCICFRNFYPKLQIQYCSNNPTNSNSFRNISHNGTWPTSPVVPVSPFAYSTLLQLRCLRLPPRSRLELRFSGTVTQQIVVILHRRFGTNYQPNFQRLTWKRDRYFVPKFRARNCHYKLLKTPEERCSHTCSYTPYCRSRCHLNYFGLCQYQNQSYRWRARILCLKDGSLLLIKFFTKISALNIFMAGYNF
jgi:hypothetical protein